MHLFLKDWTNIDLKIKKGDIVTIETLDGKYSYDFEVFDVWYYDYTISLVSGGKIGIERIKAINGKPVDFKNNWDFKKNINYIH